MPEVYSMQPSTAVPGAGRVAWSPDGLNLGVAHTTTPFMSLYGFDGRVFTKLANPSSLPPGNGVAIDWSPDGQFVAHGSSVTPFVTVYVNNGVTWAKTFAAPSPTTTVAPNAMAFSPSGAHLAIALNNAASYLMVYAFNGSTLTKIANPDVAVPGIGQSVAWSPDGAYLAVGHNTSPFVSVYAFNGTALTKIANPAVLTGSAGLGVAWSPSGNVLAVAYANSSGLSLYSFNGTTLTSVATGAGAFSGGNAVAFSPGGTLLAVGVSGSGPTFLNLYSVNGTSLTALGSPATQPFGSVTAVRWSANDAHLAVSHANAPFVSVYRNTATSDKLLGQVLPRVRR